MNTHSNENDLAIQNSKPTEPTSTSNANSFSFWNRYTIPRPLFWLSGMLLKGGLRKLYRYIKTPTGAFITLVVCLFMGIGLGPSFVFMLISSGNKAPTEFIQLAVPAIFISTLSILAAGGAGKQIVELQPAELQFVVAGPFRDEHLLNYRLFGAVLAYAPLAMFFTFYASKAFQHFLGAFLVILTGLVGILVFTVGWSFLIRRLPSPYATWARIFIAIPAVWINARVIVAILQTKAVYQGLGEMMMQVCTHAWDEPLTQGLSLPFRPWVQIGLEPIGVQTLMGLAWVTVVIFVLWTASLFLCNGFDEYATEGIAKRARRLDQMKQGGMGAVTASDPKKKTKALWFGRRMGVFPKLAGFGPNAWLHIVMVWRSMGRLTTLLLGLGIVVAIAVVIFSSTGILAPYLAIDDPPEVPLYVPMAMGVVCYLAFLLLGMIPLGLSINNASLQALKAMPMPTWAIVVGSLSGFTLAMFIIRFAFFLPAFLIDLRRPIWSIGFLFSGVVADLLLLSSANLISTVTNLRSGSSGQADMLQGGRSIVVMIGMMLLTMPSGLLGGLLGGIAFGVSQNPELTLLAATIGAAIPLPFGWWITARYFAGRDGGGE